MTDELKERVKSLGEALTDFANAGGLPKCSRADVLQLVAEFVAKYATPLGAAVEAYRLRCERMNQIIVEAGGQPVRSVVAVGNMPGENSAAATIARE